MYRPALRGRRLEQIVLRIIAVPVDDEALLAGTRVHVLAVENLAAEKQLRQRILQALLDHALERPRAVDGIVARLREPIARLDVEIDGDLAHREQLRKPRHLDID